MSSDDKTVDVEAEAAEWVIRLGEGTTPALQAAFDAWVSQGVLHREAYDFARATWSDLGAVSSMDLGYAETPELAPRPYAPPLPVRARLKTLSRAALLAPVLALLMLGGFTFWYGNPVIYFGADYIADTGSTLDLSLPDGSRVELSSGSAIAMEFDGSERALHLLAGKAYFIVAPQNEQEPRPFSVTAKGVTTTALGTEFMVDLHAHAVDVLVTDHSVSIDQSEGGEVLLAQGHAVSYRMGRGFTEIREDTGDFSTAWRKGMLVFDNQPLDQVLAEINRHVHGRLLIRNETLAKRRVSGIFDAHDARDAVDRIAHELGLRTLSLPPLVTVLY